MRKLTITLIALCAGTLVSASAGLSTITIDGEVYDVFTSPDGRWFSVDVPGGQHYDGWNFDHWSEITGPDGFRAEGFPLGNGEIDWTVTDPGRRCHGHWH